MRISETEIHIFVAIPRSSSLSDPSPRDPVHSKAFTYSISHWGSLKWSPLEEAISSKESN